MYKSKLLNTFQAVCMFCVYVGMCGWYNTCCWLKVEAVVCVVSEFHSINIQAFSKQKQFGYVGGWGVVAVS